MRCTRPLLAVPAIALALTVILAGGAGTSASFVDASVVTAGPIAAATLSSPATLSAAASCVADNGILTSTMDLHWGGVTPPEGTPAASAYDYQIQFLDRNNANHVLNTVTVPHTGIAGAQQRYGLSSGTFTNLLGLNWLSQNRVSTRITSHLSGTSWFGSAPVLLNWTTTTVLGVTSFHCSR